MCIENYEPVTTPFQALATLLPMRNLAEATISRISLGLLLAITLMGAACGYSHNYMNGTGMPTVTQLSPSSTVAGGAAFTLTVQGSGFGTDSLVYWGTTTRATTYDSASEVTADITAADIMNAGSVQVYVHSGGANSNAMTFTITP
ncbi:hypothetical protein SBA1_1320012 [Candidatus Sulfotelmatobacter kueseliae]|uniref:IPT/TIG domain-containing protein n=1 Tax=Candidatus Sulfotelmatobacter kueseliae TaxID=2042962 RepID=A0A2U3K539_9BACT|nr:hypothetical protein SBA1_1320012 [Candidatus Sulfotelmatobacter kueseliae]